MRHLDQRYRVGGYSLPEVATGMARAALNLDLLGAELNGRKVQPGPLASAICLWWMNQGPDVMFEAAKDGLKRLEELMNSEEQGPIPGDQLTSYSPTVPPTARNRKDKR